MRAIEQILWTVCSSKVIKHEHRPLQMVELVPICACQPESRVGGPCEPTPTEISHVPCLSQPPMLYIHLYAKLPNLTGILRCEVSWRGFLAPCINYCSHFSMRQCHFLASVGAVKWLATLLFWLSSTCHVYTSALDIDRLIFRSTHPPYSHHNRMYNFIFFPLWLTLRKERRKEREGRKEKEGEARREGNTCLYLGRGDFLARCHHKKWLCPWMAHSQYTLCAALHQPTPPHTHHTPLTLWHHQLDRGFHYLPCDIINWTEVFTTYPATSSAGQRFSLPHHTLLTYPVTLSAGQRFSLPHWSHSGQENAVSSSTSTMTPGGDKHSRVDVYIRISIIYHYGRMQ